MNIDRQSPNIMKINPQNSCTILTNPEEKQGSKIKQEQGATETVELQRLKSKCRQIVIGLIISLSAINYGISLKEITSVHITTIVQNYHITIDKFAAQSILIGILPFGAIFGVLITKCLLTRYRRLLGIYIFTIVNVGAIVLVNITNFGTLIAGRFIEGICIGYYTNICPIYLKEIAPKEMRRMMGVFFSLGKIVGVLVSVILELIFDEATFSWSWRILLSLTAFFSVLQAILIFFFGSDTPTEMIQKGNEPEALKIIQKFYKHQFVDQILNQYKKQYEMELAKGKQTHSEDLQQKQHPHRKNNQDIQKIENFAQVQSEPQMYHMFKSKLNLEKQKKQQRVEAQVKDQDQNVLTYQQKRDYAYYMGLHLNVIRHWLAGNLIITQGGQFITVFNETLGKYTSIIINSVQFVFVLIGLFWVQKLVGKRPLFLFSVSMLSIINISLGLSMMYSQVLASLMLMIIYMMVYGGSFISPAWSYPSEVIPASMALVPNIFHWTALALEILIPPLIAGGMPNNNAYPVFFFFGVYGIFGFIHVFRCLRQSDGKTYNEIIKSYR